MRTQETESRGLSLSLWMDEESAATADDELVPLDAVERHLASEQPPEKAEPCSSAQWAYLHRPVVPLVDGTTGASA